VTAPDSPAVAAARRIAASYREGWVHVSETTVGDVLDGVLAELDEARRQPRVWLEGDEVPAGVVVIPASGHAFRTGPGPYRVQFEPLVEAVDYAAVVAAEREQRAAEALRAAESPAVDRAPDSAPAPREAVSDGSQLDCGPSERGGRGVS
jgi:hypothetical protein